MRVILVSLVLAMAYLQIVIAGLRHDSTKRAETIAILQSTVDRQEGTISDLRRGLHYQVQVAAALDKARNKK